MTLDYTISAAGRTAPVYGRIKIDGVTSQAGEIPGILAQVCFGSAQSPICEPMTFSSDAGDLDEYVGTLKPQTPGTYFLLGPLLDEPGCVLDELAGAGHADRPREP